MKYNKANVISCFGNVTINSAAKLCGVSYHYVYATWKNCGFENFGIRDTVFERL